MKKSKEKPRTTNYKEVMKRLKRVKLKDYKKQDVIDRYIAYGRYEDFENVEVQKLLIKHDLIEWLIWSVATIIKDKTVIESITREKQLFMCAEYTLITGKITGIEMVEDKGLPKGTYWLIINFTRTISKSKYSFNYLYCQTEWKYKNELEQNIGKELMAVVRRQERNNNEEYQLCCFLRKDNNITLK